MNTVWSENIQGIKTLYLSRKLRFDDTFSSQFRGFFKLDPYKKLKILEIGCGPGALAGALHRWYPASDIHAVDRDSRFIDFAKENEQGVSFSEDDIAHLPYDDGTFDVVISNTVQEHVEPSVFWGEQYRILKRGGVCICLSSRKGINRKAPCLEMTETERKYWDSLPEDDTFEKYRVCRYPMSESELPAAMARYGFTDISTGYAVADLTPDDPKYPAEMAQAMIEANRQCEIEGIMNSRGEGFEAALQSVNNKYDERVRLYNSGVKQWDTDVSIIMMLRGAK